MSETRESARDTSYLLYRRLCWFALVLCALVSACGEAEDEDAAGRAARRKCDVFITTYCNEARMCALYENDTECTSHIKQLIDCGRAVAVSDSYSRCISDMQTATCEYLDPLPASCSGAILTGDY